MVLITRMWLKERGACKDVREWCLSHGNLSIKELYPIFIEHKKYSWLSWLLVRLMNKRQRIMYSVFATELVLNIFEKRYPEDKRPRLTIETTKTFLNNPCKETKAAADAAYAAAYATDDETQKKIVEYGFNLLSTAA